MRISSVVALAAMGAAFPTGGAQARAPQARVFTMDSNRPDDQRAALGISPSTTGTLRDTLGVVVLSVTRGSPAERAGLEEGNRIAAINGVSLRANAADVEDAEMSGALTRRLSRELAKVKAGDEVELRVYRGGQATSMKIRTASADSVFRRSETVRLSRAELDDRPALGFGIGSSGSRRDTLGVLVMSVPDSTPAARAGLEEGNRIAAINGVNLRVAPEDAGDDYLGSVKAQRLQREISQLKPGSDVSLRVYANGQFRDVRMKVARAGDLPRNRNGMTIRGGDFGRFGAPMPPVSPSTRQRIRVLPAPGDENFRLELGPEFRRQMESIRTELELLGPELESVGPALERLRPEMDRIRTELPRAVRQAREAAMGTTVM